MKMPRLSQHPPHRLRLVYLPVLLLALLLAQPIAAAPASPPPAPLGPGWHNGSAAPVPPEEARAILDAAAPRTATATANEAAITPEIQAIAAGLDNDPKLIFDLVRNQMAYVPTFGSMNGATATFQARRGNDWDQASLLIALLRAAGISAEYVEGDVSYSAASISSMLGIPENVNVAASILGVGGVPSEFINSPPGVKVTRVWVEAQIDGQTVTLDPAFKRHTVFAGVDDFGSLLGYDRTALLNRALQGANSDANSVQGVNEANIRADLTQLSTNLLAAIEANFATAQLHEIIGGATIVPVQTQIFGTDLPEALAVENVRRFQTVPANRRHTLRLQHAGIDKTFATHEIANRRVSIRYDGPGNAPVLRVEATSVMTGTATTLNASLPMTVAIDHPYAAQNGAFADQSGTLNLQSGGVFALLHDFGGISQEVLNARDPALLQVDGNARAAAVTADEARIEALHQIGLTYVLQEALFTHLVGRLSGVAFVQHHTLGVAGQTDGFFVDIPFGFTSSTARESGASGVAAFRTLSAMGSALEHGVLEQASGTAAASAVKLLQLSNASGAKIFLANSGNFDNIKPQLSGYSAQILAILQAAIDAGRTLVLPQNGSVSLNQYTGVGYVEDFRQGNSASTGMIIFGGLSGSLSGGFSSTDDDVFANLKDLNPTDDDFVNYKSVVSQSGEPVEMADGAYILERQDLSIGPDAPRGLAFERFYISSGDSDGPLGAGWQHNYDSTVRSASSGPLGLGAGQPQEAAPLLAYIHVSLDLLREDPILNEWVVGLLATKWGMDQLIDNARIVSKFNRRLTFVRRADGGFNPAAGTSVQFFETAEGAHAVDPMGAVWFFDPAGRVRVWIDRNGNPMNFEYDGQGRLTGVTDAYGNSLTYAYDATGRVASVIDSAGRAVQFSYTGSQLTAVTDPEGNVWRYAYDDKNQMTQIFQAESSGRAGTVAAAAMMTNEYDSFGRVVKQTDGEGNVTRFGWSDFRNAETYPDGSQLVHHYNARGQLTALEDAAGKRFSLEIDGRGFVRKMTDKLGATEQYTYSLAAGMLAALSDGEGNTRRYSFSAKRQTVTNPVSPTQSVSFDFQELTRIDYPDGTDEQFVYDAAGNPTQQTDRSGAVFNFAYNGRGQLTKVTNPSGGVTDISYNADATVASITDSDTGNTTFAYDGAKRISGVDHPDGSSEQFIFDGNDLLTRYTDGKGTVYNSTYDANRNLIRAVAGAGTGIEQTRTYAYDTLDRLIRSTDPAGGATNYTYTYFGGLDKATLPDGTAFDLDYDSRQRVQQVTVPTGQAIDLQQDDEGLLTGIGFPSGRTIGLGSDSRGFYTSADYPTGSSFGFSRDSVGRVIQVRDRLSSTIDVEYDGNGRLLGVTTPGIGTVRYLRDSLGALTEIRTLSGSQWTFANSPMGRRTRLTDPLGNAWQYAYDSSGRLQTITHPDGGTETRTYDANDNLIERRFSGGLVLGFTYDALDRLTATASEPVALSYDSRDNITRTEMHGVPVETAYDANSRITSVKYGSALMVNYTYNGQGQVTKVEDSLSRASVSYVYDTDGLVIAIDRSNGVRTDFTRDGDGRITRIRHGDLGGIDIDYDASDNVLRLLEALPDDASSILAQQVQRLLFDPADQIISPGFSNDARGRRTGDSNRIYSWDGADRLVGITEGGTRTVFDYTALGDAATRTVNGTATDFLYNYAQPDRPLLAELRNGSFLRAYVYAPGGALLYFVDVPLAQAFFYHFNHVGTTLFLTDANGQVSDTYGYTIFGEQKAHSGPNGAQLFTFVGEWGVRREGDSGLYQMRARYYDSRTLRFLSREPLWPLLAFPQALNPYQYAFNNPLRFVDPSGLVPENATAVEDGAVTQGADSQIPQTNSNKIQASQKQPQPNEQTGDSAGSTDKAVQMAVKQVTLSNSGSTSSTNRNVSSISDALNQTGSTSRANGSSSQQVRGKFIDSYTSVPRRGGLSSAGNFPTIKLKNPLEFSEFTITDPLSKEIDDCYSKTCTETFIGVFSSGNSNSSLAVTQPTSTRLPYQNLVPVVLLNLLLIVIFIRRTRDPGSSNEKKDESNVS